MKHYQTPEITSLEVMAHDIICASPAPAPSRNGSITPQYQVSATWN